jgi:hypothetical protein
MNQKDDSYGRVKLKTPATYDGNKPIRSLADGLAKEAECGCGIECQCYGFLTLKNWDATEGTYTYAAVYIVDGALVVGTVEEAKAAIDAIKNPPA